MPSPVDDESRELNDKMRKGVENNQNGTGLKFAANYSPTDLLDGNKTGDEEFENVKNVSKSKEEHYSKYTEKETFIMAEQSSDNRDFVVNFSCTQCACIAQRDYKNDKEFRRRRKSSKRCVCVTVLTAVIFCLSVVGSLVYLTFKGVNDTRFQNRPSPETDIELGSEVTSLNLQITDMEKDFGMAKFELDVVRYNSKSDNILPWNENHRSTSKAFFHYHNTNKSVSVLRSGVYFIQATLSADANCVKSGQVTMVPCISFRNTENCQRMKIPAGMAIPIYLQDIVKLEAFETVQIKLTMKKSHCLHTGARRNLLNIVHLK